MEEFCPYRICPIGAHIDHQYGVVSGACVDIGIRFIYDKLDYCKFTLKSKNYKENIEFDLSDLDRKYDWADYFRGVIYLLSSKYVIRFGISGLFIGDLPSGGISSSTASMIVFVSALSKVNNILLNNEELIELVFKVEKEYMGLSIGLLDPSSIIYGKSDCLMFLDTLTNYYQLIENKFFNEFYEFIIIYSGVKRELVKSNYNKRVEECNLIHDKIGGVNLSGKLRDISDYCFYDNTSYLDDSLVKRGIHYYQEMIRVKKALRFWRNNDMVSFGNLMNESCLSSIYNYESGSDTLIEIFNIFKNIEGVLGVRFLGAGFDGSCLGLIEKSRFESIKKEFGIKYCNKESKITRVIIVDGVGI